MKRIIYLSLLGLCICNLSIAQTPDYPTNVKAAKLDAAGAKKIIEYNYNAVLSFGEAQKTSLKDSVVYVFSANGNLASKMEDGYKQTYEYNKAGQLSKVVKDNGYYYAYTYANGKLMTVDYFNSAGNLESKWKRTYSGTVCTETEYDASGNAVCVAKYTNGLMTKHQKENTTQTYSYNATKKLIKNTILIQTYGRSITVTQTNTYNAKGLLSKESLRAAYKATDHNFTYKYDAKGHWIVQNNVSTDNDASVTERTYTY